MKVRAVVIALSALAGCNAILGIEEQGVRPVVEDAGSETLEPPSDRCSTDAECKPPNGCYTARCDTVLGACVYSICESKTRACRAGRCIDATSSCDPNAERDYSFKTTGFNVPDVALGCLLDPTACVVAVHPFLFVGTKSGVVAILVEDLLATSPKLVPVRGFDLPAVRIVASGRRVWLLGAVQGTAAPYRVPVAYVDVPSDPTRPLDAKLSTFAYSFPTVTAFAAPFGNLFLAHNDAAQGLPAALLVPPLPADGVLGLSGNVPDGGAMGPLPLPNATHVMHRVPNAPLGSTLVAASGNRLLAYRFATTFNLVTDPAQPNATAGTSTIVDIGGNPLAAPRFASGPDGVVAHTLPVDPLPMDCNCISQQRLLWTLPNAAAEMFQPLIIAYEGYTNPSALPCPTRSCTPFTLPSLATWIDAKTMLTAAPGSETQRALTAVRVVSRDPLAAPGMKRFVTVPAELGNFAMHKIALTSAAGFGYLLVADAEGNNVAVSIFDPRCENQQ